MRQKGFTITELLVVISVIVILAAIIIVTYSTAQNNGYDSAVKSDLDSAQGLFESFRVSDSSTNLFPQSTTDLTALKLKVSTKAYNQAVANNYVVCVNTSGYQAYDIAALSLSGNVFVMSQDGFVSNSLTSSSFANTSTLCSSFGASYTLVASGMNPAGTWASWMNT